MKLPSIALAATLTLAELCAAASAQQHFDQSGTLIGATASALSGPSSTLQLTSATTAYSSGQLIGSSATAGSVVVPSFSLLPTGDAARTNTTGLIPRLRLSINDSTSTAWGAVGIQIDLWSSAPTFSNGDRATWSVATGAASHLGAYSCTMSAEGGDGVYGECAPSVGQAPAYALGSSTIFWTAQTTSASGVTGASKVMTLKAEVLQ